MHSKLPDCPDNQSKAKNSPLCLDSETLEIDLSNEYNPLSAKRQKTDLSRKEHLTITSDPFFKHHLLLSKESFSIQ